MITFNISQKILELLLLLVTLFFPSVVMSQARSLPYVTPPRWSPDGSKVAVTINNTVEVWDATTEQVVHVLRGHTDFVASVAWSPDNSMLATASSDQTVKLWSATDGTLLHILSGHNDSVTAVTWSPDGSQVVSSGLESEPSLFVWDPITGDLLFTHSGGTIVDMAFSPDGQRLALSSSLVFSIIDGESLAPIVQSPRVECCANQMYSIAWSPDGNTLATGSINGLVTLWDASTAQMLMQFMTNRYYQPDSRDVDNLALSWVRDVAFTPDGSTVLSVSGDGTVREWQTATGILIQETHIAPLFTAVWSPYSGRLAVWEPTAQKAADLSNGQVFDPNTGEFTIVVPAPSRERLQAIAEACIPPTAVEQALTASIEADQLTDFVAQVEALPEDAIAPACAADLIAVAEALQNQ